MTPEERLLDNLIDMQEAATEAIGFLDGVRFEVFEQGRAYPQTRGFRTRSQDP